MAVANIDLKKNESEPILKLISSGSVKKNVKEHYFPAFTQKGGGEGLS